jgi:competence protein ComEC
MDDTFKAKTLFVMLALSLVVSCVYIALDWNSKTEIVFCDVGQGDAALIRMAHGIDILIDAGPSRDVLDCLGKYMPFTDRYIDIGIISHPHLDHYGGFVFVLDRYRLGRIITTKYASDSQAYQDLLSELNERHVPITYALKGLDMHLGESAGMDILWPTFDAFGNSAYQDDPNAYSIVVSFYEGMFSTLFTGDATPIVLKELVPVPSGTEILKVPHHGSDDGLTQEFLATLKPQIAVISVGETNGYNHPSQKVLEMLKEVGVKTYLTSKDGDIRITINPDGTFSQQ